MIKENDRKCCHLFIVYLIKESFSSGCFKKENGDYAKVIHKKSCKGIEKSELKFRLYFF